MGRLTLNALLSFAQCKKDRARFGHAARPCRVRRHVHYRSRLGDLLDLDHAEPAGGGGRLYDRTIRAIRWILDASPRWRTCQGRLRWPRCCRIARLRAIAANPAGEGRGRRDRRLDERSRTSRFSSTTTPADRRCSTRYAAPTSHISLVTGYSSPIARMRPASCSSPRRVRANA